MSMSSALANALTGLTATSRGAEVVSSNVANALTDGYGRRRVDLSAQQIGGSGGGVQIDGITRLVDQGIINDRRLADASLAFDEETAAALAELENLVGSPDSSTGLNARLTAVEQALVTAASDPASDIRLQSVVNAFNDLTRSLKGASDEVQQMRVAAESEIALQVDTLNRSLQQVEDLNADIFRMKNIGRDPSGLLDQRQRAIDTISTIVPVRELTRDGGQVALMTTSGELLLDGPALEIGFVPRNTITPDMTVASGGLETITVNGLPVTGSSHAGRLAGGSLGAAFELRDETLVGVQDQLDGLAADLATRFQQTAVDPTVMAGVPGLLTDTGGEVDPTDIVGLAGRLSLNTSVDPDQGGDLSRLRDGVAAVAEGPAGDASQLIAWSDALLALQADSAGATRSASGHFGSFVADIGTQRLAAQDEVAFSTARWETLRQAELEQGVDTDFEMQMLLRIEEAYSANAKVLETVNFLMQRLMEI